MTTPIRSSTPVRTRVLCPCGRTYAVFLERRVFVRKGVRLPGRFRRRGHGREQSREQSMVILNLSRTGLMFEPESPERFQIGDALLVDFSFGTEQTTHVCKQVSDR